MKRTSMGEYPIRDYGVTGNCETAALINSDGGIDWLCLPAFDSPSFLGALLNREKGGDFLIRPLVIIGVKENSSMTAPFSEPVL